MIRDLNFSQNTAELIANSNKKQKVELDLSGMNLFSKNQTIPIPKSSTTTNE
jgi:hypothetical protein